MDTQYQDSSESLAIKNWEFLPDGTLKCWARIAKVGTYDYGSHKQEVSADTLFDSQSLDSIVGRPVTLEHPPSFIMSVAERKQHQIGTALQETIKEIDGDETYLTIPLIVWDEAAISDIVNKKVNQFSPGYNAKPVQDSNKIIQKDRRYNHFSLTVSGRGGEGVRALVDSNVTLTQESQKMQVNPPTNTVKEPVTEPAPNPPTVPPQAVPELVPTPVPAPTPAPVTPPSEPAPQPQQDSAKIAELVRLHAQYQDSFQTAGITQDYNWTSEELKRRIVTLQTGKDATALNESQCDAILTFLTPAMAETPQTSVSVTDSVTVPNVKGTPDDAEAAYMKRLENAYKTR